MNFGPRFLMPLLLILLVPAFAFGEVPDIEQCDIYTRATQDVSILICPGCDGVAFSDAQTFGGSVPMDATIEVIIANGAAVGLVDVDAGDIHLEDPGLVFCPGGNLADFNTIEGGYTEFADPLCGGGCSQDFQLGGMLVDEAFIQNPIPYLQFNSPDSNGDLVVNLADLGDFAGGYYAATTDYCFDLYWDGEMNLNDLAIFAQHYGVAHSCP